MGDTQRWVMAAHRGLYVHAFAFLLTQNTNDTPSPGPKWGYVMGVGQSKRPTIDMHYGSGQLEQEDYFTREAAEQAALDLGRRVADVLVECR